MSVKSWSQVEENAEPYSLYLMDCIQLAAERKGHIDRPAMAVAAIFVGVIGLVGIGRGEDDFARLSEVAVDLTDDILVFIERRMQSLKLESQEESERC